jgi:iron complex outermembrane receptor protein
MKPHAELRWFILPALLATGAPSLPAQTPPSATAPRDATAATGVVTGRVQNVVTGQYLNNVRVAIKGTGQQAFTDQAGVYRLTNVPTGPAVLEVFYTGLDAQSIAVNVTAGQTVERDVDLSSVARYGQDSSVVKLDSFVISSSRETDANSIATNEQRFAANIKNVVAADSFGDIPEGNIGEFMKFLPGVTVDYVQAAVRTISVRGFADNLTAVAVDGAQMASSASGAASRSFELEQVSINNVSRIELTKVPTPSTPADSLAGSVNMVSKSAFERSRAQFRYRLYLSANHENLDLEKTPHSFEKYTYKVLPGFDFDYTLPISKTFGLVITGLMSNQFNEQHLSHMTFNAAGTGTGASFARPYFQQHTLQDGPTTINKSSTSIKADWKFAPHNLLSVAVQANYFNNYFGTYNWVTNAGTNAAPTVTVANGGTPFSYGDNFTVGATGRGAVTLGGGFRDKMGATTAGNVRYTYDDGNWKVQAGLNHSTSRTWYRATGRGHFAALNTTLVNPVRVTFRDLSPDVPGTVQVFDNSNRPVDIYDINSYRVTTATDNPVDAQDKFQGGDVSLRRALNVFSVPSALQIGGLHRIQNRDIRRNSITWTYAGINGNTSAAPLQSVVYRNQDNGYGYRNVPYASPHVAWRAFEQNPALFTKTPAQLVTEETYRINNSEYMQETVSALYLQAEARFLRNRLQVLTGARYERTEDEGQGPLYDPGAAFQRDAAGRFLLNAAGQRVRKPEAGALNSMEELRLTRAERAYLANRSYDGVYPSLHLNFNATENFVARLAYAKTYGRPNFSEIIPNATISENDQGDEDDPEFVVGTITLRNTGLKPWTADNYDLSLEYYTPQGGVVSAGAFLKEVDDFFGNDVRIATEADLAEFGLPSRYLGWRVNTTFNSGNARISGVEFNVRQSLQFLGGWGRHFSGFVNATKLKLKGDRQADFNRFIEETVNWGFTFSRKPVTFMAKWNYRGRQKRTAFPTLGPDAFEYYKARVNLDLNLDYTVGPRLAFFLNARNVFNEPQILQRFGSETPAYAKQFRTEEFGIQFVAGIKGAF